MKTEWRGKIIDVEESKALPHQIREGNLIVLDGEVLEVETIQRDCPGWNSSNFTVFILRARDGRMVPTRDLFGKQLIYKKKWSKVYV